MKTNIERILCLSFAFLCVLSAFPTEPAFAEPVEDVAVVAEFTEPVEAVAEVEIVEILDEPVPAADVPVIIKEEEVPVAPITPDMITYGDEDGWPILAVNIEDYNKGDSMNFKRKGTFRWNDWRWTYYTSKQLYHYRTKEWFACDDGLYRTAEGYIVVASQHHEKGTILETPFGAGIVLDYCGTKGTIDIYTHY